MMNYIWSAMVLFSFACALIKDKLSEVTTAVIDSGYAAVTVFISLYGVMILWGGLMNIAVKSGLTALIGRMTYPLLRFLFPGLQKDGDEIGAISMNITANLLGLGNAATPLGIEAMNKLKLLNSDAKTASDDMVMLVVLNSASLHLIPTSVALLRSRHGSASPMEILLPGLCSSAVALFTGVSVAKLFSFRRKRI